MTRPSRSSFRLLVALAFSLLFHALPFVRDFLPRPQPTPRPPPLVASLRPPPAAAVVPEDLRLEQPPAKPGKPPPPEPPRPKLTNNQPSPKAVGWEATVQKQLRQLDDKGLLYPAEAIAQRLEGVVQVLFVLDESGQVVAARVEESCGHAILDQAALRAVRSLRALPADTPREAILPVRFRLK